MPESPGVCGIAAVEFFVLRSPEAISLFMIGPVKRIDCVFEMVPTSTSKFAAAEFTTLTMYGEYGVCLRVAVRPTVPVPVKAVEKRILTYLLKEELGSI